MDKKKYQELVKKHSPKENSLNNALIAFFIGGMIGVLGQFLIDLYVHILDISNTLAGTLMVISLIFISCFLTAIGKFDKMVEFARCGLIIPITGFAHSMMSSTLDYKREGFITGIGSNMFKLAGTVILYGIVSAYFFGLLRYIFFGGNI